MSIARKHDRPSPEPPPHAAEAAGAMPRADFDEDELRYFQSLFPDAAYYSTGRAWTDYAPAYRYGRDAFERDRQTSFEQIEPELARGWEQARPPSRLAWAEARGAVLDAWRFARSRQPPWRAPGG